MINTIEFTKRLQKVIDYYDESASSFAEKIGVQRSSISHILSGRNKPSLDFVMKILHTYPNVELYWLLNGKGDFPKKEMSPISNVDMNQYNVHNNTETTSYTEDEIEKIIVLYKNGTFKSYLP
ncbi:helix-turn-helix domain-containing protein [Winogradskyella alexanderae]|uniref:Helix-turn-helix domain-containing protein n=1 Tax=Winogradskyella alexanderae TaxID=2877123 RepID=A0ABS7XRM4_9FLAO|nr:helix-turn-helix transcriptional regulator [Winogradskyella alexanderae]MCA0132677.1 helix-turn-helix domain-containing protein [Winogradskyella alexanderae]